MHPRLTRFACLLLLLCASLAQAHISYDSFALRQIREKFEKKLDTNYFLHAKAARQGPSAVQCSSEDGPYCRFVNRKSLVDRVERNNSDYLLAKEGALGELLRRQSGEVVFQTRRQTDRGQDFLFFDYTRAILDELLYPQLFARTSHFLFSFETFERGKQERRADKAVHYDVEAERFNSHLYPFLRDNLAVQVDIRNLWIPAQS